MYLTEHSVEAVLLLDPPVTTSVTRDVNLDLDRDPEEDPDRQPTHPAITALGFLPAERITSAPSLALVSMFDDIISFHDGRGHDIDDDPRSCTILCRKIVIAHWIAFLRRRYLN